jgi:hypothetical protein
MHYVKHKTLPEVRKTEFVKEAEMLVKSGKWVYCSKHEYKRYLSLGRKEGYD